MARRLGLLLLGLLSACALVPDSAEEAALRERPARPGVHVDLVRGMLEQGQNHAALAHIEELERSGEHDARELLLLRATAQYQLGQRDAAEHAYRRLLRSPFAGQAHHGLALLAAREDLALAVRHFNAAAALRPTDAQIRNDLGYTLLLAGRLTEARHHLRTATELAPARQNAKANLVLSRFIAGEVDAARALAREFGIPEQRQRELEAESEVIQRLMARRAEAFSAGAEQEWQDDETDDLPRRTGIPGLYRDGG